MNERKIDLKSISALVVDDMSLGRLSARNFLRQCGLEKITMVSSGLEAWELLEKKDTGTCPFQLILCDWIMPDMNGIDLVRKLKTKKWSQFPHVILVTAETDRELVTQAINEGIAGYIKKPLTLENLQSVLSQLAIFE